MRDPKLEKAKRQLIDHPDVTSIGLGYRYRGGKKTQEVCLVVGVRKKKAPEVLLPERIIPRQIDELETDVQEKVFVAYSYTQRMRPCPPGFSIGHPRITAGTLGAYVRRGTSDDWVILSNNHVIAASNQGLINDRIIQPGKADGGFSGTDAFALLTEYAHINFDGQNGKKQAAWAWKAWSLPAHFLAWLLRCPYRLRTVFPRRVDQPSPNLVDAAIATPMTQGLVKLDYPGPEIGELMGIRDLQLGDRVHKVGRTTEYTKGTVEVVGSMARVSYGTSGNATFDDQLEIRADSGEFSAGGDSGSAIISEDGYIGGLLFAGGAGVTVANRISNVVAILGVRF